MYHLTIVLKDKYVTIYADSWDELKKKHSKYVKSTKKAV